MTVGGPTLTHTDGHTHAGRHRQADTHTPLTDGHPCRWTYTVGRTNRHMQAGGPTDEQRDTNLGRLIDTHTQAGGPTHTHTQRWMGTRSHT